MYHPPGQLRRLLAQPVAQVLCHKCVTLDKRGTPLHATLRSLAAAKQGAEFRLRCRRLARRTALAPRSGRPRCTDAELGFFSRMPRVILVRMSSQPSTQASLSRVKGPVPTPGHRCGASELAPTFELPPASNKNWVGGGRLELSVDHADFGSVCSPPRRYCTRYQLPT
jgi:hypothetical protein